MSIRLKPKSHLVAILWALALLGLAAGCLNPYKENYLSALEKLSREELSRVLPASGPPKLVTSNDMREGFRAMLEKGYIRVGRSKFRSSPIDEKLALDQAKAVGAEVALVNRKFVNSVTESVPISVWDPGRQIDHQETTVIQEGSATPTIITKQSSVVVQGEFKTAYVEQNTDYYDYTAVFWARGKPPLFGVHVKALDDKARAAVQSNRGVQVRVVIQGSPAFDADILKGDVLLSLGGEDIRDPDQFFDLVMKNRGLEVPVEFYRDGQTLTTPVALRNE